MFQGNWSCSTCGGEITELPFEPRSTTGLTCRVCFAKKRSDSSSVNGQTDNANMGERPRVEGNWSCSGCGGTISSLPFTPRDTSNLLCVDCYKKSKS